MKKQKWLKIGCDDRLSFVEITDVSDCWSSSFLEDCYRELDCDTIEIVRAQGFDPFFKGFVPVIIIDECGKLKPSCENRINSLCSLFYASGVDCIVGDALLGMRVGSDVLPFPESLYEAFAENVSRVFSNIVFVKKPCSQG